MVFRVLPRTCACSFFSLGSSLWLIIGSFLNVCIYRLPRGQSIVMPRSYCPDCGHFIHWYDNAPVLSFLILGGHCRNCKRRIPFRYPLVELLTGIVSVLVYWKFGVGLGYLFYFVLFGAPLIAITFIDLEHRIIPDVLSIPGIFSGTAATVFLSGYPVVSALLFSLKGILV